MFISNQSLAANALPITISVEEASAPPGIGPTVAYGLVLGGQLRSVKIGLRRVIVRASIEESVARLETTGR